MFVSLLDDIHQLTLICGQLVCPANGKGSPHRCLEEVNEAVENRREHPALIAIEGAIKVRLYGKVVAAGVVMGPDGGYDEAGCSGH
jgi:hypothetical protein